MTRLEAIKERFADDVIWPEDVQLLLEIVEAARNVAELNFASVNMVGTHAINRLRRLLIKLEEE